MCHLNWNITWAVALEVTNINFLIAHFAAISENIISLHVSLTFGTVCQTVLPVVMTTGSSPIIRGVRLLDECQVVGRVHFLASDWSARD